MTIESASNANKGKCGNCAHFDRQRVDGSPVDLNDPTKGFCRVNMGLLLGQRGEDKDCAQPQGFFARKRIAVPAPTS